MNKLLVGFFMIRVFVLVLFIGAVHGVAKFSCSQTPYPELCNNYVAANPQAVQGENLAFRDVVLRATVDQAKYALQLVAAMDQSSFDKRAKLAWADCLELYEDSVHQLNRSAASNHPKNIGDAQTWLSAAVANHQTCMNGFIDFNLSSHLESFPTMLGTFSKLLSNSLAVNKQAAASLSAAMSVSRQGSGGHSRRRRRLLGADGFPGWVSAADRKLLQSGGAAPRADVVVAGDGSGNFKTISEAVAAAANRGGGRRFVIYVKAGVYRENVQIKRSIKNLMLIGDGIDATVVTGNKNGQDGSTTFRSATFGVAGDGFIARGMTFENTAGPEKHQAVAFRSGSDHSVFYGCSFKGYQDTLYVYAQRQFYRNCDIYGTIDFIFGDAAAVFQNCNIYVRKPMSNQWTTVTAQARSDPNENTGIVIHNSRVTGSGGSRGNYLGRPWKKYSRTVFMKTFLDGLVSPRGWLEWSGSFALSTLYYGEYMNTGSGANTGGRVKWPGYHVITSAAEAGKFTVESFLAGSSWIPPSGVPFSAGL